ncbi:MAG: hypothetical protein Fur0012_06310 [Elusimicrobiota bacterium]
MKKLFKAFFSFSLLAGSLFAGENPQELYKKGDFESAAKIYLERTESNPYDYAAFYNYANCMYRLGDNSRALAYYMKAFTLNPRNSDLFYNLNYLSRQTGAGLFPEDIPSFIYRIYFFLSMNEIRALLNISLWIFCLTASAVLLKKKESLAKSVMLAAAGLCLFFSMLYFFRTNSAFHCAAVITENQARIMSGPGEDFKLIATSEGTKTVRLLSQSGEWSEIGLLGQGLKGWIKSEQLIKI